MNEHVVLAIRILNTIRGTAYIAAQERWSYDMLTRNLEELQKHIHKDPSFKPIDLGTFTIEDFQNIGALRFKDDTGFMMVPFWILPYCDESVDVYCVSDITQPAIKLKDAPKENYHGFLKYCIHAVYSSERKLMNRYQHRLVVISAESTAEEFSYLEHLLESGYEIMLSIPCPGTSTERIARLSAVQHILRKLK
jgi:hypothetical protein